MRFSSRQAGTLLAVLGVATVAAMWLLHDTRFDDAYITFRYGQHLALGRGPVFNPTERTLGTTSPGEMLLSSLVYALVGLEGTPSVMAAIGRIAWVAQPLFVFLVLRKAFAAVEVGTVAYSTDFHAMDLG